MRGSGVPVVLAVFLLAGCLSGSPPAPTATPNPEGPALAASYSDESCENALLFQFVDYTVTDAYLPPGFHPRDPQEFLGSPAAFGQAGVLFISVDCNGPAGNFAASSIDLFVQPPAVQGVTASKFDFYELDRYSNGTEFGGLLARAGWPLLEGTTNLTVTPNIAEGPSGITTTAFIQASVDDVLGSVATLTGTAGRNAVMLGDSVVRFWNQDPQGLSYYEYDATLDALVGGGLCTVREGSPLAAFTGEVLNPLGGEIGCPSAGLEVTQPTQPKTGEPVIATFLHLKLDARAASLPGERAA